MRSGDRSALAPTVALAAVVIASLASAACAPMPPASPARIVSPDEQAIPAPIADAVQRAAQVARNVCLGRGYGEASVTFDNAGSVMRAKVERADEIADVECVEKAFRSARVPAYTGAPLTVVASFELDAMRSWKPAAPLLNAPGLGTYR